MELSDSCMYSINMLSSEIKNLCEKKDISLEEIEEINALLSQRDKYLRIFSKDSEISLEEKHDFVSKLKISDEKNINMLVEKQEALKAEILKKNNINAAVSFYKSNFQK